MPERFLAIAAHPDDLDFGAAGTTASLTAAGLDVVYCLVTNGDAGGHDNSVSRREMAEIRQREQTAAAKVVGVEELHFLGFPDGGLMADLELRKAITRVIRQVRPDKVITQSPQRDYERIYASHPDHLAVGEATICSVYPDSRNQFAFPTLLHDEGLEPHTVTELWIMETTGGDHFVDITDTFDAKIEALLCHTSQMTSPDQLPDRMSGWGRSVGQRAGLGPDRVAEAFRRIATP